MGASFHRFVQLSQALLDKTLSAQEMEEHKTKRLAARNETINVAHVIDHSAIFLHTRLMIALKRH